MSIPDKDETLKKLSSFANTFGGFMVIGARARSTDGRIEDLPGVDVRSGYKQQVVQWCFDGASPPLTVEISDPIAAPVGGKVCYVLYAPESDAANIWGLLFYALQIDRDHDGTLGIHLYEFVGSVLLFIRHAGVMLQMLGYPGTTLI